MAFTARTETYARGSSLTSPYNFTINKATGVVDGDIMFMFLAIYLASPPTIDSVPSGWTLVATNTTTNSRWYLYYKIASSEGASYVWSLTASCRYYALNIAYSSGDFDVQSISDITAISNTLYPTAGAAVRAASMNVPDADSPLVYFGAIYNTTVRTFTKPSVPTTDWVEDADEGNTTPDLSVTNGSMIWTGSGNTGNMDITCSTSITTYKHAFAVALKPKTIVIVEGTSSGSGDGLASSISLLTVLGASAVSGAGLASSLGILNIFGVASASGNGLASLSGILYILTPTSGQGVGLGIAIGDAFPPYEIIEGIVSGSGVGVGVSLALQNILAQAQANGIGLASSLAYLDILAQANAVGDGVATALAQLEITGQAQGNGLGLASAIGAVLVIIEGLAEGSGEGDGFISPLLFVFSQPIGSGEGLGQSDSLVGSQELYDLFAEYEEEYVEGLAILQYLQPKVEVLETLVTTNLDSKISEITPVSVGSALNKRAESSVVGVGVVVAGDYLSTWNEDGDYYQIADDNGEIDLYLEFNIETGMPTGAMIAGCCTGLNDNVNIYIYNWLLDEWGYFGVLGGKNSPSNQYIPLTLYVTNVGTGDDEGKVRIRFTNTGLTDANLYIDQAYINYSPAPVDISGVEITTDAIKAKTDNIPNYPAEAGEYSALLAALQSLADLIKQIQWGRWKIINNQMIFYDADNVTPIRTFNLYNKSGQPAEKDIYERLPV